MSVKCDETDFECAVTRYDDIPVPVVEMERRTLHRVVLDCAWVTPTRYKGAIRRSFQEGYMRAVRNYGILME